MLNRRSMCWKVILLLICLYLPALGNFCFWLLWCFSPLFLTIFFLLDSFQNFPGKWNAKACSFVNSFWPFKQPLLLWYIYLLAIYIFFSPFVCGLFPSQIPLFAAAFFLPFYFFFSFFFLSSRDYLGQESNWGMPIWYLERSCFGNVDGLCCVKENKLYYNLSLNCSVSPY